MKVCVCGGGGGEGGGGGGGGGGIRAGEEGRKEESLDMRYNGRMLSHALLSPMHTLKPLKRTPDIMFHMYLDEEV